MVKPGKDGMQDDRSSSGDSALDRNVSALTDWLKDMPLAQMHPLMQQPMAAMAAATAVGIGISGQIAGFILGAMQGLNGVTPKQDMQKPAEDVVKARAPEPAVVVKVPEPERAAPVKAVRKVKATAKVAVKPKADVAPKVPRANSKAMVRPDDLKQIAGVGPKLEQVLNRMGVMSFGDIAAWSEADIARIDAELGFNGRIVRDGWIEQAKTLSKGRK